MKVLGVGFYAEKILINRTKFVYKLHFICGRIILSKIENSICISDGDISKMEEKSSFFAKIKEFLEKIKTKAAPYYQYRFVQMFTIAFFLELFLEMLSRRSVIKGTVFVFTNPIIALYSILILMCTLSISYFFRKKNFFLILVSILWLGLGVTNCVVLGFRTTPLSLVDFELITSVWTIVEAYLSVAQAILIVIAVGAVITALVFIYKKIERTKVEFNKSLVSTALLLAVCFSSTAAFLQFGVLSDEFPNLPTAYKTYGFVYCFTSSALDRGIDKPGGYSGDVIDELVSDEDDENPPVDKHKPNIIYLQLESYFDVNYMKDLTYSENPVPVLTELKKTNPYGFMTVPAIGAGTANTEFEIITQMSLDYFGTGEYPYKTILKKRTCESISYNLKELDYATHAIHNHSGAFYDRNEVFAMLGFDTYTSLEYMDDVQYTPKGWAKDYVLTEEILKALESTKEQDLVYCISVQPHGKYPSEDEYDLKISVEGFEDESRRVPFEYYVNQVHETDEFLGQLISALESYPEDVVLVFYGDHLPSLDIDEAELSEGNLFQTEYIIWSNYGLKAETEDIYAFQLSSQLFSQLGYDEGTLTKYHQEHRDEEEEYYLDGLELLEYDILYGDMEVYGGVNPFEPTDIKMGTEDIVITSVKYEDDGLWVTGENFTTFSVVNIDGQNKETMFINEYTLMVSESDVPEQCEIAVLQIGKNREPLSSSNIYSYMGNVDYGSGDALPDDELLED